MENKIVILGVLAMHWKYEQQAGITAEGQLFFTASQKLEKEVVFELGC